MFRSRDPGGEPPEDPQTPVHLAAYTNYAEAELDAQRLNAAGIPALVLPLGAGGGFGSTALFAQEVRVRAADLERAQQLLGSDRRRRYRKWPPGWSLRGIPRQRVVRVEKRKPD